MKAAPPTLLSLENEAALADLARALRRTEGFALFIARCNQPVLRQELAGRAVRLLGAERTLLEVELAAPVENVRLALLERRPQPGQPSKGRGPAPGPILSVVGLERSIPSEPALAPALHGLNMARELFRRDFPTPLLLWLPDYAVNRLAREAPDFWSWRSGVYDFRAEMGVATEMAQRLVYGEAAPTENLTLEQKQQRLALLRGLLADYRELGQEEWIIAQRAGVLHRLASLLGEMGDYGEARRLYEESLEIRRELGDRAVIAASLGQLGNLSYLQGDYGEARRLYEGSLEIARELGDRAGIASSVHQLGMLAHDQGDYAEARRLYGESLGIARELGNRAGIAISLHQLGRLEQEEGDLQPALALYEEAHAILSALGSPDAALAQSSLERVRSALRAAQDSPPGADPRRER